jgi:hypothetical protein
MKAAMMAASVMSSLEMIAWHGKHLREVTPDQTSDLKLTHVR